MKKQITKQELEEYYLTHTAKETCEFLGIVSFTTLYSYLKRLNIKYKGQKNKRRSTKIKLII